MVADLELDLNLYLYIVCIHGGSQTTPYLGSVETLSELVLDLPPQDVGA